MIKFLADVKTMTWEIREDSFLYHLEFGIGFREGGSLPVKFEKPVRLGVSFYKGEDLIIKKEFPKDDEVFVFTDQETVHNFLINGIVPKTEYRVDLFFEYGEHYVEESFNIKSEEIPQPYPSWIFDEDLQDWTAPYPLPDTENEYVWNESLEYWVRVKYDDQENFSHFEKYDQETNEWIIFEEG